MASIHENNIYGKCTAGDNWSSDQGIFQGNNITSKLTKIMKIWQFRYIL